MSSEESEDDSTFRVTRLGWRSAQLTEVYQELDMLERRDKPQSSNLQGEKRRVEASGSSERHIPTKILKWPGAVQQIVLDPNYPRPSPAEIKARVDIEEAEAAAHDKEDKDSK